MTGGAKHIAEADGIRGMACLIVLFVHASAVMFPATYAYLEGCGKIGVWLFFSLSAFLLTHQLIGRGLSRDTLIDYFVGRTLRIYPLFAFVVLIYWLFGTAGIDTADDVFKALTFQKGYAHFWTIPVEFKFYFVLPVIVAAGLFVQDRVGTRGLVLVGLLAVAIQQLVAPYRAVETGSIDTFQYLPAFLFGAVAAFVNRPLQRAHLISWTVLAGVLLSAPFIRYALFGTPPDGDLVNKYLFFSLAWSVFIVARAHVSTGLLHRWLTSRAMRAVGLWSYSIYLMHWLIVVKLSQWYPGSIYVAVVAVGLSIAAGAACYALMERPLFAARKMVIGLTRSREGLLDLH